MDEPITKNRSADGIVQVVVAPDHEGLRLDQFLTAAIPAYSRAQIQRVIKAGLVRSLEGQTVKPGSAVRRGQIFMVEVLPPAPSTVEAEALPLTILYQDADLVVVDKPAGMVVHPAAGHPGGTLVNALLHHIDDLSGVGGESRPGIVHRLDRLTSGLMVVAKCDHAHQELARAFHDREVEKEYVALAWGLVEGGRRIDAPIGRDPVRRQKMSTRARRTRRALTRVLKAEHLRGVSLLHLSIATGRTHQIRVHLHAIGHPVVGDAVYGGVRRRLPPHLRALATLTRPFLHAARLAFTHPTTHTRLEFKSPLPADLIQILDDLHRDAEIRW